MNATRYLADRHVCGCFRFTLASSHLPTCGEGTGAVFQGESRPCPPLHRGVLEASFVYNSATGSDQSISSALLTHLDPTSSPNIALDRPTNRVKTRGHVFANERSIVFLRSNMRCVALHSPSIPFQQNWFWTRTRVISPAYNGFFSQLCNAPLVPCSLFCNDDEEVGGKMIPLVFPVLVSFVFSLPCYLYLLYCTEAARGCV